MSKGILRAVFMILTWMIVWVIAGYIYVTKISGEAYQLSTGITSVISGGAGAAVFYLVLLKLEERDRNKDKQNEEGIKREDGIRKQ